MVSPINKGTPIPSTSDATQPASTDNRTDAVNAASSPNLNIPNDGANYHWFLPEITGSRLSISPSHNGSLRISADMGVNNIATRILSHLGG